MKKLLIIFSLSTILFGCAQQKETLKGLSAQELLSGYEEQLESNNYDFALEHLREIEAQYPYSNYAQQAMLNTAYVYYKKKDSDSAISAADRFIHSYPTHDNVDYAYYLKGLTNYYRHSNFIAKFSGGKDFSDRDQQNAIQSFDAFNELINRFPTSKYAPDAREKMVELHDTAAKYIMRIASFYYKKGAYVAVVNRSKYVLENYPQSLSVEDALGFMALSYKKMGINDLKEDTVKVIKANYPQSSYLSEI